MSLNPKGSYRFICLVTEMSKPVRIDCTRLWKKWWRLLT